MISTVIKQLVQTSSMVSATTQNNLRHMVCIEGDENVVISNIIGFDSYSIQYNSQIVDLDHIYAGYLFSLAKERLINELS